MSSLPDPRRIVTGHDKDGRAIFESDKLLTPYNFLDDNTPKGKGQLEFATIWRSDTIPADNQAAWEELNDKRIPLSTSTGATARYVDFPPGPSVMHRTVSLDFGIVIKGEIVLELDDGAEKLVKEGDVVVQRGTIHAWHNRSDKNTRMLFVLLPAKPITVGADKEEFGATVIPGNVRAILEKLKTQATFLDPYFLAIFQVSRLGQVYRVSLPSSFLQATHRRLKRRVTLPSMGRSSISFNSISSVTTLPHRLSGTEVDCDLKESALSPNTSFASYTTYSLDVPLIRLFYDGARHPLRKEARAVLLGQNVASQGGRPEEMFAFDATDKHFATKGQEANDGLPADRSHNHTDRVASDDFEVRDRRPSQDDTWITPGFAGESPVDVRPITQDNPQRRADQETALHSKPSTVKPRENTSEAGRPSTDTAQNGAKLRSHLDGRGRQNAGIPPVPGDKAAKRKKKKEMKKAAPALQTIRGFTPAPSGDEDSDHSTATNYSSHPLKMKDWASPFSSPTSRPLSSCSHGGISALKLKVDNLSLDATSEKGGPSKDQMEPEAGDSGDSVSSEARSDVDAGEMTTYTVPLEHDFVSPDAVQKPVDGRPEAPLAEHPLVRKMAASDFEPLNCLGKGTFGTVLLVKQKATGRLYAQKQFRKASLTVHKRLVEQTKTERVILESVNRHPFVVKLYYAFQDHEKLYLILEYAQGGELFTHLAMERMFSEDVAAFYMAEMVLALEHLHQNVGVVYRDLKPENCLLDSEGHLLLTDFGLSKVAVDGDHCKSVLGTIEYMAPEVVQGNNYNHAVDWWSLGALGFDLLTGSPPFQGNNHAKIQERILKQKLSLPYFLSPDAKDLLTRLLRKEPNRRLGANMPKDLQIIRKHRFFRKIDWKKLERRELEPPIKPLITDPALAENFSKDFTDLALSPVVQCGMDMAAAANANRPKLDADPFGGFSFVASHSLLAHDHEDGFHFET
ncbi:kinase-like protein [Xylona heveae TC161]|uniref:Kinase-like protein n=1 Tax=Xylona heveae (strain CBS 132557 / TC161) TaxID=1328760 RepID=A0A164ZYF5_XYLHT|nr:kinase-like protein [Xylona heveae TC161]KZF19699.1 kinase-like protein [Xylona heveae TC161]